MSLFAAAFRAVYKISGVKKVYARPEEELLKVARKQNESRGFFMPTDNKAHYEKKEIRGYPCLIVRENEKPARRAILYFFGGGMLVGSDKGDIPVIRKMVRETSCDVWFPAYPLCTDHCITESYDMVYECYRQMLLLYGDGNVSTCCFSKQTAVIGAFSTIIWHIISQATLRDSQSGAARYSLIELSYMLSRTLP